MLGLRAAVAFLFLATLAACGAEGQGTFSGDLVAITSTPVSPITQPATPPASPTPAAPDFTQVTVYPSLYEVQPSEVAPGQEVKLQGSGGLIELRKPDGSTTGYIESARSFEVYLEGNHLGTIQCYVNVCNGAVVIPASTGSGDHEISVEGGSSRSLTVIAAATPAPEPANRTFALAIDAFPEGGLIPDRYTCEGEDVSPALFWGEPPPRAQSLAVVMDDPDAPAGVWDHWVLFNLPPVPRGLPEAQPRSARLNNGAIQGGNSWPSGNIGYRGPCPPPGSPHSYRFFLYAVDGMLDLAPGAAKGELLNALEGHVVGESVYTGEYQR